MAKGERERERDRERKRGEPSGRPRKTRNNGCYEGRRRRDR
jgi:hypothetical protein